jgi:hypothetical protein
MPNWVHNILTVDRDFERIREYCKSDQSPLDFNKILPCPQKLRDTEAISWGFVGRDLYFSDEAAARKVMEIPWIQHRIPNPDSLTLEEIRDAYRREFDKNGDEYNTGKRYRENTLKYGAPSWYEWCVEHWGTKWNAREVGAIESGFTFITAWGPPWGIIGELMRQFPGITFTLVARDEPCNGYWEVVVKDMQVIGGTQETMDSCPRCRAENSGACWRETPDVLGESYELAVGV